jgi:formylglycine-generating enzyme required for sulfatase activity
VSVDLGPSCVENMPCTERIPQCHVGRTRCVDGAALCVESGNEAPGTICPNGTCDGRGACLGPEQRSCPSISETGCGLVYLLGGTFALGSTEAFRASPVQSRITVGAFAMDAYEVTVARFQRFLDAGSPRPPADVVYPSGLFRWSGRVAEPDTGPNCNHGIAARQVHPVNCVDWSTAQAFCVWDGGRLPTEAEWEFAARHVLSAGLDAARMYPWGNAIPSTDCDRAHWNRCPGDDMASTRRVGRFAPSAGFYDLTGNVWEWTADLYAPFTDRVCWGSVARENPRCALSATGYPSTRGASWNTTDRYFLRAATRDDAYTPTTRNPAVGFRCARTRTR